MSVVTVPARRLEWDSSFFGFPVAQAEARTPLDVEHVDVWAAREEIRCLYLLVSAEDDGAIQAAEARGFFLTGIRVTCACVALNECPVTVADDALVRPAEATDIALLEQIAAIAHSETRFYADPHFSRAACNRLYETWIRRSCEGWADHVLVLEANGHVCGYISLHLLASGRGSIGLVAVDTLARRRGIGRSLVAAALRWFHDRGVGSVSVATQAQNIAALRLYQQLGFSISCVHLWLHKWW